MSPWFCTTLDSAQFLPRLGKVLSLNHFNPHINEQMFILCKFPVTWCMSACMCLVLYVSISMVGRMYIHCGVWRQEIRTKCFQSFSTFWVFFCFILFFQTRHLTEPGARLFIWPMIFREHLSPLPQHCDYRCVLPCMSFIQVLGTRTQVPVLVEQTLYLLIHHQNHKTMTF